MSETPQEPGDGLEEIPTILPWQRQPGESSIAFSYFAAYRDQGLPHSVPRLARELGMSSDTLFEHSARWDWVARTDAYEDHLERQRRLQREALMEDANRRQAELAIALQQPLALRLNGGQIVADDGTVTQVSRIDPNTADWSDLTQLAKTAVTIERMALGMPTDILKTSLNAVSADEYRKLARGLFEIALRYIDEQRQARFAAEVEAFYETGHA